jgi:hypothetical protein
VWSRNWDGSNLFILEPEQEVLHKWNQPTNQPTNRPQNKVETGKTQTKGETHTWLSFIVGFDWLGEEGEAKERIIKWEGGGVGVGSGFGLSSVGGELGCGLGGVGNGLFAIPFNLVVRGGCCLVSVKCRFGCITTVSD